MLFSNVGRILVIAMALIVSAGVDAQTLVYKWVDEHGVVHFGDAPPEGSDPAETATFVTDRSPPAPVAAQSTSSPAIEPGAAAITKSPRSETKPPALYETTKVESMTLGDLDLRCEEAREKMIAPLRAAEIATCKLNKRESPLFCEQFNADFGDGGQTFSGAIRPRMFDDLPECVQALQETIRRAR
jgi:hypothetical protein